MSNQGNDKRPLSPHLQIWRWHPAMMSSILDRACIVISYAALIKFALALLYITRKGSFPMEKLVYSPLGLIGSLIGFFAITYMILARLRHLIWDQGKMFDPVFNNKLSWVMMGAALFVAIVSTAVIAAGGA